LITNVISISEDKNTTYRQLCWVCHHTPLFLGAIWTDTPCFSDCSTVQSWVTLFVPRSPVSVHWVLITWGLPLRLAKIDLLRKEKKRKLTFEMGFSSKAIFNSCLRGTFQQDLNVDGFLYSYHRPGDN